MIINRHELISLLYENLEILTVSNAALNLLVTFICTIIIYIVYFFTSKDVKPTVSFAKTILITALSTCLVIMLIGTNLALSLGMVGALSVIRFRAAVKDSRDAAFIFYAVAVGMTSAMGVYALSFMGTLFIGTAVVIFSFFNIGSRTYVFTVRTSSSNSLIEEEISKAARKRYSVIALAAKYNKEQNNPIMEAVYEIGLKKGAQELCTRLLEKEGVESVNAVLREDA